ncbi:MAG: hypothetical protein N3B13_06105, partial [Deltaproteobacteria bacterium]|nr:hypothetical protein [Deltaproteobacteria bacterium]
SVFEAKISAAFITAKRIYYYIAAWDGESPVETGRNRSILPDKAEDLIPVYFIINILGTTTDAGIDTGTDIQITKDTIEDTIVPDRDTSLSDETETDQNTDVLVIHDVEREDRGAITEDLVYYEDVKKRTSDLSKLGEEEEGGCGCTIIE